MRPRAATTNLRSVPGTRLNELTLNILAVLLPVVTAVELVGGLKPFVYAVAADLARFGPQVVLFFGRHGREVAGHGQILPEVFSGPDAAHERGDRLRNAFSRGLPEGKLQVDVTSFGFKRGVPRVLDLLFDARFLPNPHWVPELRDQTGRDAAVRDYVFSHDEAGVFVERVSDLLDFLIPEYEKEGKSYLTIGIGCTGGRHRSVAIADAIATHLLDGGVAVTVHHRDAGLDPDDAHQH